MKIELKDNPDDGLEFIGERIKKKLVVKVSEKILGDSKNKETI